MKVFYHLHMPACFTKADADGNLEKELILDFTPGYAEVDESDLEWLLAKGVTTANSFATRSVEELTESGDTSFSYDEVYAQGHNDAIDKVWQALDRELSPEDAAKVKRALVPPTQSDEIAPPASPAATEAEVTLQSATVAELKALATKEGLPESEWNYLKKPQLIEYLVKKLA